MKARILAAIIGSFLGLNLGLIVGATGFCLVPAYMKFNPEIASSDQLSSEVYESAKFLVLATGGVTAIVGLSIGAVKPDFLD
jgi:hypothetical protein